MKVGVSADMEDGGGAFLGYHAGAGAEGPIRFRGYLP